MSRTPWRAVGGWSSKVEDNAQRESCKSNPKGGGGQPCQRVAVTVGEFVRSGVGASKCVETLFSVCFRDGGSTCREVELGRRLFKNSKTNRNYRVDYVFYGGSLILPDQSSIARLQLAHQSINKDHI